MLKKIMQTLMGEPYDYRSPDETFLQDYDGRNMQQSSSQRQEIAKARAIAAGRDQAQAPQRSGLWEGF